MSGVDFFTAGERGGVVPSNIYRDAPAFLDIYKIKLLRLGTIGRAFIYRLESSAIELVDRCIARPSCCILDGASIL